MKNLAQLNSTEFKIFLESFDNVLCDCDGVIWALNKEIPGVRQSLEKLKQSGKKIRFVSNNCTHTKESFYEKIKKYIEVGLDDILYPTLPIIDYLKKAGFNKDIFFFGPPAMKQELVGAGFKVICDTVDIEERLEDLPKLMNDNENIGAVVVELDMKVTFAKLMQAAVYLQRPDVFFIVGGTDKNIFMGLNVPLLGAGYLMDILENLSGHQALCFGKPSKALRDYISEKFDIKDPSRTLFIGDSLNHDIVFAHNSGYQKLFVLSGISTLDDVADSEDPAKVPDYYIKSLGDLCNLMKG